MKTATKPNDLVFAPERWPWHPYLPLTRRRPSGDLEMGVLVDCEAFGATVFLGNLFELLERASDPEGWKSVPQASYASREAVLEDGWNVD